MTTARAYGSGYRSTVNLHSRRPERPGDLFRVNHWSELSACVGKGELFFFEGEASRPLLMSAVEICKTCPVQGECLKDSSKEDQIWSVRGGQLPLLLKREPERLGPVRISTDDRGDIECRRGHKGRWRPASKAGSWKCLECELIRKTLAVSGQKLERLPPSETCAKGHNDWKIIDPPRKGKIRECRECRREVRRRMRAKAKAAKIGA